MDVALIIAASAIVAYGVVTFLKPRPEDWRHAYNRSAANRTVDWSELGQDCFFAVVSPCICMCEAVNAVGDEISDDPLEDTAIRLYLLAFQTAQKLTLQEAVQVAAALWHVDGFQTAPWETSRQVVARIQATCDRALESLEPEATVVQFERARGFRCIQRLAERFVPPPQDYGDLFASEEPSKIQ